MKVFHPSGYREILVRNMADLQKAEGYAVRMASTLGRKKRTEIEAKAAEMNLKILNPKTLESKTGGD